MSAVLQTSQASAPSVGFEMDPPCPSDLLLRRVNFNGADLSCWMQLEPAVDTTGQPERLDLIQVWHRGQDMTDCFGSAKWQEIQGLARSTPSVIADIEQTCLECDWAPLPGTKYGSKCRVCGVEIPF